MRVLRIIARLNVGGPARHVVWLTRNLSNDDFDSVLVAGSVRTGAENALFPIWTMLMLELWFQTIY